MSTPRKKHTSPQQQINALLSGYKDTKHKNSIILSRIEKKISKITREESNTFISHLLENKIISKILNCTNIKRDNFISPEYPNTSSDLILRSFSRLIEINKNLVNQFEELRQDIEENLILGNPDLAINTTNKIELLFGNSIWLIDARMTIYAASNQQEKLAEIHNQYKDNKEIGHLIKLIFIKLLSKSLQSFMKHNFLGMINDYKNNGRSQYADFLSIFLVPTYFRSNINVDDLLNLSMQLTPIDRLYLYKKLLPLSCSKNTNEWSTLLIELANKNRTILNNKSWTNANQTLTSETISKRTTRTTDNLIQLYSKGDYQGVTDNAENFLKENPRQIAIIDLIARSYHHCNLEYEEPDKTNIGNGLLSIVRLLIEKPDKYEFSINTLESLALKLNCFDVSNGIPILINCSYPYMNDENYTKACKLIGCSDLEITPKYCIDLSTPNFSPFISSMSYTTSSQYNELSPSRKLRWDLEVELNNTPLDELKILALLNKIEKEKDILPADYFYLWSESMIKLNEISLLIKKISSECSKDMSSHILFPLKNVIKLIDNDRDHLINHVESVICYYLNFRLMDFDKKEEASEAIEDFLNAQNLDKPSDVINTFTSLDPSMLFFLKHVCTPEMISILVEITTDKERLIERLKILSILSNNTDEDKEIADEEKDIYNKLISKPIKSQHSENKIYIDIEGLKKSKLAEYNNYLEIINTVKERHESNDNLINLLPIIGSTYGFILDDFIFNKNYGLVRNLSSEIRHGTLSNQLRSVVEANNLITVKGKNNIYEKNYFWSDKYKFTVSDSYLVKINAELARFSMECDALIERANQWPTASLLTSDKHISAFIFDNDIKTATEYYDYVNKCENAEELFNKSEEFIWNKIDIGLINLVGILNTEIRDDFNKLFDKLLTNVTQNYLTLKLKDLTDSIRRTKNLINEEITTISSWFKRPSKIKISCISIEEIITSTIEITRDIYKPKTLLIQKDYNFNNTLHHKLGNKQALALISVLTTAYQNAIKHGLNSSSPSFSIKTSIEEKKVLIQIVNLIDKFKLKELEENGIVDKCRNFTPNSNESLLTTEGGTGLYKSFHKIIDNFNHSYFSVKNTQTEFTQIISIGISDNENITR